MGTLLFSMQRMNLNFRQWIHRPKWLSLKSGVQSYKNDGRLSLCILHLFCVLNVITTQNWLGKPSIPNTACIAMTEDGIFESVQKVVRNFVVKVNLKRQRLMELNSLR